MQTSLLTPPRRHPSCPPACQTPRPRPNHAGLTASCTSGNIVIRLINFPRVEIPEIEAVIRRKWLRQIWARQDGEAYTITLNVRFRDMVCPAGLVTTSDKYLHVQTAIVEYLYNRGWVFSHVMLARSRRPAGKRGKRGGWDRPRDGRFCKEDAQMLVFARQREVPPQCRWLSLSTHVPGELSVVGEAPVAMQKDILDAFEPIRPKPVPESLTLRFVFSTRRWGMRKRQRMQLGGRFSAGLGLLKLRDILEDYGYSVYACVESLNAEGLVMILTKPADAAYLQRQWVLGR